MAVAIMNEASRKQRMVGGRGSRRGSAKLRMPRKRSAKRRWGNLRLKALKMTPRKTSRRKRYIMTKKMGIPVYTVIWMVKGQPGSDQCLCQLSSYAAEKLKKRIIQQRYKER